MEIIKEIANIKSGDTLVIPEGEYFIKSSECPERKLFITNTIGDKEYKDGEKPHIHKVGILLENLKNVTISGYGAKLHIDGKITNIAMLGCENITIEGIEIVADNPDLHEFVVTEKKAGKVVFKLDSESRYIHENGHFYFVGTDYKTDFFDGRVSWPYHGLFPAGKEKELRRTRHPFFSGFGIKEESDHVFSVKYLSTKRFNIGDRFAVYDVRRTDVGIFSENSKNITIKNVKQRFNCSLAFVAQNTDTITIEGVEFCPAENQEKRFVSFADFVQVCMCKGDVKVTDSVFSGAGDDVLNVHGTHFALKEINANKIVICFKHPQSHGYLAFNPGDVINFNNKKTLLTEGTAVVKNAKLLDEYDIELELEEDAKIIPGTVIENATLCPNLYFARNKMSNIVTRGLLITTSGNVVVEDNIFESNIMPCLLFSDDAMSWYESGACKDVTIKGNTFIDCDEAYIRIKPENGLTGSTVHGDFIIENNIFCHNKGIEAHGAKSITLRGNKYKEGNAGFLRIKNIPVTEE